LHFLLFNIKIKIIKNNQRYTFHITPNMRSGFGKMNRKKKGKTGRGVDDGTITKYTLENLRFF